MRSALQSGESLLRERLQTGFLGIIAFALVLFLLVQARFMLICLAIAIIIFALTSDAISAFARLKVPNWLATTLSTIGSIFVRLLQTLVLSPPPAFDADRSGAIEDWARCFLLPVVQAAPPPEPATPPHPRN